MKKGTFFYYNMHAVVKARSIIITLPTNKICHAKVHYFLSWVLKGLYPYGTGNQK
jgi:hypothetical protein